MLSCKGPERGCFVANVLMHPTRYRIVALLAEQPMHLDALSRALDTERMLVAYHLMALQEREIREEQLLNLPSDKSESNGSEGVYGDR